MPTHAAHRGPCPFLVEAGVGKKKKSQKKGVGGRSRKKGRSSYISRRGEPGGYYGKAGKFGHVGRICGVRERCREADPKLGLPWNPRVIRWANG